MKSKLFAVICCVVLCVGCSSAEKALKPQPSSVEQSKKLVPQPQTAEEQDQAYARAIEEQERMIQEMEEQYEASLKKNSLSGKTKVSTDTPPELPPIEERQALLDEIYQQLKHYQSLNIPSVRDDRTDKLIPQIYFDFDKNLLKPAFRDTLIDAVRFLIPALEQRGDLILQIEGHADERGTPEYNIVLGHRRATTILNFLSVYANEPERLMEVLSFGEEKPAVFGSGEDAWSLNRRVMFTILLRESE
ncbi:OmpA family protein [Deltaproteobacteria bacterium TL4]